MELFDRQVYINRRKKLKDKVQKGKILLLGNDTIGMNYRDNYYNFRQDSTFLYYFGLNLPGLYALMDADNDEDIIFGHELSIDDIIWTGHQPSLKSLSFDVGVSKVLPPERAIDYAKNSMFLPPYRSNQLLKLAHLTGLKIDQVKDGYSLPLIYSIAEQRNIKSEYEIERMNYACNVSNEMHKLLMKQVNSTMKEYDLVSLIEWIRVKNNVNLAYPAICTKNGQVLHNHYYGNELKEGDLVLVDSGYECPLSYASDLTRTFPVSKTFTSIQKDVYQVVLNCYHHARKMSKPGVKFYDIHCSVGMEMTKGLKHLGLIEGNVEDAYANKAFTAFFPHGLGHLIGLDVHDMENFGEEHIGYSDDTKRSDHFGIRSLRLGRSLQEGYCITIEPGVYFIPELMDKIRNESRHNEFLNYDKFEQFKSFGGIRIEDNFVIRADGAEKLGDHLALTTDEIETLRNEI